MRSPSTSKTKTYTLNGVKYKRVDTYYRMGSNKGSTKYVIYRANPNASGRWIPVKSGTIQSKSSTQKALIGQGKNTRTSRQTATEKYPNKVSSHYTKKRAITASFAYSKPSRVIPDKSSSPFNYTVIKTKK